MMVLLGENFYGNIVCLALKGEFDEKERCENASI